MKRAILIFCAVAAAACENPKAKRAEMDRADVRARLQKYSALMLAMDDAGVAAMFAPDGALTNPRRPPVKGRDSIRKFLADYSDFKVLANTDTATSTLVDGDTAEQIGTYAQKVRAPSGKIFDTAGRLEVEWIRGPSGNWLIAELETFPGG